MFFGAFLRVVFCWLEYCQTDIDHGLSFGFSILFYETDREISEQCMVSEE